MWKSGIARYLPLSHQTGTSLSTHRHLKLVTKSQTCMHANKADQTNLLRYACHSRVYFCWISKVNWFDQNIRQKNRKYTWIISPYYQHDKRCQETVDIVFSWFHCLFVKLVLEYTVTDHTGRLSDDSNFTMSCYSFTYRDANGSFFLYKGLLPLTISSFWFSHEILAFCLLCKRLTLQFTKRSLFVACTWERFSQNWVLHILQKKQT